MTGSIATALLAGTASASVALARPDTLPLRPLATTQPASDGYQHVLVRVPAGAPLVPATTGATGAGAPSASSGVDLAALARYQGRVDRLERGPNGRVLAILTDGSSVDVTAGAGSTPTAPAPPSAVHAAVKDVPAQLLPLATDSGVVDISPVDATTWRVTGDLPADRVATLTGLSTHNDVLMQVTGADDTYRSLLWALHNDGGNIGGYLAVAGADVKGVEANRRATGAGVIVAVIDSGIQPNHPDLPPLWHNPNENCSNGLDNDNNGYVGDCNGWDFVHNDNTPYDAGDNNDHGTHVAGTIAAIPNNGQGTAGLAPGVSIMNLKVTANGSMWMSDVAKAIRYAANNGAKVINASLGTSPGVPRDAVSEVENAIAYAGSKGVLVVAAAGNDGVNTDTAPQWPADLPLDNIISVGASTAAERPASFSNYGATSVDLFAPGHYIVSTVDKSTYAALQGTSMATPHVAAAAALVLSVDPALSPAEVKQRLMSTVDQVDVYRGKSVTGGRLNADRAVAASGISLEASAFHDFSADTAHTGNVTVKAAPGTVPAGVAVTPQATLLTLVDGTTYGVLDQPLTVDGKEITTDANAQALLGPADGVDGADPALTGSGMRVAVGTTLPAGQYALVVDLLSAADHSYSYGRSNAIFFMVLAPGQSVPAPTDPTPTAGTTPPPYVPPAAGPPPVMTGPQPAPGTVPGPGTAPGPGTVPGAPGPGTVPGPGTAPRPAPGTIPGPGTGTIPGPGSVPPAPAPAPAPSTIPGPGTGTIPGPGPGTIPGPGPGTIPGPGSVPSAPGTGPAPAGPPASPPPSPVTDNGITITSITPGNGPAGGGTAVMITGSGFPTYPVVSFGGVGAYVQSRNPYVLTVIAPSGAAGSIVSVTVGDQSGRSVTMPDAFRYDAAPGGGGTAPGATPPGTPAPGTPAPGTPAPGTPAPGTPAPGTVPSGPPAPAGPPGSTRRGALRFGTATTLGGLHLAPVLDFNLSPSMWTTSRCQTVLCRGVVI